jgi:hypothetical protein
MNGLQVKEIVPFEPSEVAHGKLIGSCNRKFAVYIAVVAAILKTIEASVSENGVITPSEPLVGPAQAVITLIVEEPAPNEKTIRAMEEPVGYSPRFNTVAELKADLDD